MTDPPQKRAPGSTSVSGRAAPRSWLHDLLRRIDDDLVELAVVRAQAATPDLLRPVFLAGWLRMTTFEPGLGPVLWSEPPEDTMDRLERDWDRADVGHVKMTPTGANAVRAMDDPPPALRAFYAGRELAHRAGALTAAAVQQEVEAVESLALVPTGLSRAGRGRTA